jgi:hypothetical protein
MVINHFRYNEKLRELFFEHAVDPKTPQPVFGFKTPARVNWRLREPTLTASTIRSANAGPHYEVAKFDDVVDENNSDTPEMLQKVKRKVKALVPLVVTGGYRDFIGTRYDFGDAYGSIKDAIDADKNRVEVQIPFGKIIYSQSDGKSWKVLERQVCTLSADNKVTPDSQFLFPVHKTGKPNFNYSEVLKRLGEMLPNQFGCQYLNNPTWGQASSFSDELMNSVIVPVEKIPLIKTDPLGGQIFPNMTVFITVDVAFSEKKQAHYTSIAAGGFDPVGRLFVLDLAYGRWSPDKFVYELLKMVQKWRLFLSRVGIEEVGGVKLIMPILKQANLWDVIARIDWWPTNPTKAKAERIFSLIPLMKTKTFFISSTIPDLEEIQKSFVRFKPKGSYPDDIPDSISMLLWYKDHVDVLRPPSAEELIREYTSPGSEIGYGLVG